MTIDRTQFPPHTQLQGMAAQAAQWFLSQIEKNEMTIYEALSIAHHLQRVAIELLLPEDDES